MNTYIHPFFMSKICKLDIVTIEDNGFHLLVPVDINGIRTTLVLDTGASKSILDLQWVQDNVEKAIQLEKETSVGVGGSQLKSYSIEVDSLLIGSLSIKNHKTAVLDLSHVKLSYQNLGLPEIIGIIGGDILSEFNAIIDYKKLELRFD